MAHLIKLPLTPFEKTGKKRDRKVSMSVPSCQGTLLKEVEDHGTEAMAQPKSKEQGYLVNHPV